MGIALISIDDLLKYAVTGDPAFRIVDARTADEYAASHLPGAVHMSWEHWCAPAPTHAGPVLAQPGYWGVLAPWEPQAYAERLEAHGIRDDEPIVVYAGGPRSRGREGRIAWMLLYLGAREVYLLDGGWGSWRESGGPVTRDLPPLAPGRFVVRPQEQRRCRLEVLMQSCKVGGALIPVDTRSQPEFDGYEHSYLPRMGHLPGAVLLPFTDLFDAAGRYASQPEYLGSLPAPLRDGAPLVTYCEVGVRAATAAVLHEIHTGSVVAVSDGSLMEWSLEPSLPVHRVESQHTR